MVLIIETSISMKSEDRVYTVRESREKKFFMLRSGNVREIYNGQGENCLFDARS